ncbi:hypothetical protein MRB53_021700 [Persea americana]|uniref:Uncharacterized protein n=1 Tax=Persea americana TaxID=3435 RepID=A0ACC2L5S4_PERAE|nr:hypothetical protein MRB53_021700 [Persea americana]
MRTLFLYVLLHFFICSQNSHSIAIDTISLGLPLSGDHTISSKGGIFELGFFKPGAREKYYIGIWYKQLPKKTVVWVANRETPVQNKYSSQLKINHDGNLVILNQFERLIWSTDISSIGTNNTVAELHDTGNLVLRGGSDPSAVIWESFDNPTHTWLPKQWLCFGRDKVTGETKRLITWKNHDDPAPGMFSFGFDPDGTYQYVSLWNGSEVYWRTGVWNGQYFDGLPEMALISKYLMNFSFLETENRSCFTYNPLHSSFVTRSVLDFSGQMKQCLWLESSRKWNYIWLQPIDQCEVYSSCGTFGVCSKNNEPFCSCLSGFQPRYREDWNLSNWSGGCARKTHFECGDNSSDNGQKSGFFMIPNMGLPINSHSLTVKSHKECESSCLSSCSCTAFAYYNGCSLWNGDLINLQQLSKGEGKDLYLRLAATELRDLGRKKGGMTGATIDFGMAKLIGREYSSVLTSIRGTIGYLAPEWISGVAITSKVDVYSFGMMLFEIISGKRNSEKLGDGESAFFPCWAVGKIAKGEVLALLDYRLDGNANMEELMRASRVAYWCIQDDENDRPAMGNVVQILEGLIDVNMPPIPRSIRILIDNSS